MTSHADLDPRVAAAIALTPTERVAILTAFFTDHPGDGDGDIGLGRAILDFQAWEVASGRIAIAGGGSPWWRAVNGLMVLDARDAHRRGDSPRRARAVDAWRDYAAGDGPGAQAALWEAHQRSLHAGVRACAHLLDAEAPAERAFAAIVVDVVDRTALANRPTDSDELAGLTARYYPAHYPVRDDALPRLERMRDRTADALRDKDGVPYAGTGLQSQRWA